MQPGAGVLQTFGQTKASRRPWCGTTQWSRLPSCLLPSAAGPRCSTAALHAGGCSRLLHTWGCPENCGCRQTCCLPIALQRGAGLLKTEIGIPCSKAAVVTRPGGHCWGTYVGNRCMACASRQAREDGCDSCSERPALMQCQCQGHLRHATGEPLPLLLIRRLPLSPTAACPDSSSSGVTNGRCWTSKSGCRWSGAA